MKSVMRPEGGAPVKLWLDDLESSAFKQTYNVARHPAIFRHVAIMPDAHMGMGVPIGCVFASEDCVIPNAVGVDIGCGMTAVPLRIDETTIRENADYIINSIKDSGILSVRRDASFPTLCDELMRTDRTDLIDVTVRLNTERQLGTLGGGNHFIEFQKDENDQIWLMIHSGSRNLGQVIVKHYDKIAQEFNAKFYSSVNPKHKLAFLPLDSLAGKGYLTDMRFGVEFAELNREAILNDIDDILFAIANRDVIDWFGMINCAHNFAAMENHFGRNTIVHRKGATMAREDQLGLIPGSQGTSSYIVKGKGNRESFNSCSHGAGRTMSRTRAKEELDLEYEQLILEEVGVIHQMNSKGNLDEAPSAYKDIDKVMKNQEDLVDIVHKLEPILVVKN